MILIIIKFGELLLWISHRIINALRSYVKHSKECFIRYQNTSKLVKKIRLRLVFATHFSVFGYLMKHSSSCLIYYWVNSLWCVVKVQKWHTSSFNSYKNINSYFIKIRLILTSKLLEPLFNKHAFNMRLQLTNEAISAELDISWRNQEPISRSMRLYYIPVPAFSQTDLFLHRISLEWDSRGSGMTSHKKLIDVTASLGRNGLSFRKEKVYQKYRSVCKNAVT